ncbi:MAG: XdhC family protein [Alphaproteobacteria bacterium]|nr:XdhC family protein [Alphaproteobacteria bacterium]MCB9696530.1 XdhC family protein [Alphaproteobacteria bacterium]
MLVFEAAARAIRSGQKAALATVIGVGGSTPRSPGARILILADGETVGTLGGGALEHHVTAVGVQLAREGGCRRLDLHLVRDLGMCCGGRMEIYVEALTVREPLVMYGAGHVAAAVAPMLVALDYDVTVVDDRPELLTPERFAGCTLVDGDARLHARDLPDDPRRHVLIVTHDHALDQDLGEVLLPRPLAWIGMIGSRGKLARFFVRWRAAGLDEALFGRLCAPVGLDLGAETPTEIAVAIAAELVRVRRQADRPPVPLSSLPIDARGGDGTARPPCWPDPPVRPRRDPADPE